MRDELAKVIQDAWLTGRNGSVAIRLGDWRMLQKALHHDSTPNKAERTRALQILKGLHLMVIDR